MLVFSNSADQDQGLLLKNIIVLFFSQKKWFCWIRRKKVDSDQTATKRHRWPISLLYLTPCKCLLILLKFEIFRNILHIWISKISKSFIFLAHLARNAMVSFSDTGLSVVCRPCVRLSRICLNIFSSDTMRPRHLI